MVPFKPERSASQSGDETAGGAFPLRLRSGRGNGRASKSGRGQRKRESASERYKEDGGSFKSTGTAQQLHPPLPLVFCSTTPPSSPLSLTLAFITRRTPASTPVSCLRRAGVGSCVKTGLHERLRGTGARGHVEVSVCSCVKTRALGFFRIVE